MHVVERVEIAMITMEVVSAFSCVPAYVPIWSKPVWKLRQDPVTGRGCLLLRNSRCLWLGGRRGRVRACRLVDSVF